MPSIPVIAILDIGKTNKKLFLFDGSYQPVWEENIVLAETKDEDGDPCEDLQALNQWMCNAISKSAGAVDFDIRAINFSAYGASFVHVGENGEPVMPLYNYLKPFPEKIKRRFYELYGGESAFSMITASPVLGSLNSGMQLYRIKNEMPDRFSKIRYSLHLPQYLSWFLTGSASSEISSIGCHTNLWNFSQHDYHEWVYRESVIDKLPPLRPSDTIYPLHASGKRMASLPGACVAGIGLHDSSAAMIPYLESFRDPFVLISTGTWCISMNPFNQEALTIDELHEDCLCYLTYKGQQLKASRLFAGYDHGIQVERISGYFQKDKNFFSTIGYNPATVSYLEKTESDTFKYNDSVVTASVFAKRDLSGFADFEEAYHRLMMDVMIQQLKSTGRIIQKETTRIFVDGGFSNNSIYMHLLAAGFPSADVFAATVAQASAIGAAMAIHSHWNSRPFPAELIKLKKYMSIRV